MTRHLGLLPRGELGVDVAQALRRLVLELTDLVFDRDSIVVAGERPKLRDLAFKLGNRLFKIEICAHESAGFRSGDDSAVAPVASDSSLEITGDHAPICQHARFRVLMVQRN